MPRTDRRPGTEPRPFTYLKEEVMDEGTFTGAGIDSLAPRFATEHVASRWEPPHRSRWQRLLAWFGLADD